MQERSGWEVRSQTENAQRQQRRRATCRCVRRTLSLRGLSVQKDGLGSPWNNLLPRRLGTVGSRVVLHKVMRGSHRVSRLWVFQKWAVLQGWAGFSPKLGH